MDEKNPDQLVAAGDALRHRGDAAGAVRMYQAALKIDPDHPEATNHLGVISILSGRLGEAIDLLQRSAAAYPNRPHVWNNLANALVQAGRVSESLDACRRALEIDPAFEAAQANLAFFSGFDPNADPKVLVEVHRHWASTFADPLTLQSPQHPNDRSPNRRLRIGYFSPDFREHAVSYFMEGLLAHHDPREVEVYLFGDVPRPDSATARLRGYAHRWENLAGRSDDEAAAIIRVHQIDILIDLAGHTSGGRLLIFARKPAPVQVAYLGYPNTTGMKAIDYRIVDVHTDPPPAVSNVEPGQTEPFWTEQLIRLPRTFAIYRPPPIAPPVGPPPFRQNGFITFGSFAMLSKLSDGAMECWSRILTALPTSRLRMAAGGLAEADIADRIRQRFGALGVDPARLDLAGQLPLKDYLAAHQQIDILLDSFPVNGHTVTAHALWMGVPVISLAGKTYQQRLGASVLSNLDLTELLAETPDRYMQIAIGLASDPARLESLRSTLRGRMQRSPVMDSRQFARDMESVYRGIWKRYCV